MGFFDKYPYTDFHELNLDWFLSQFKSLVTDWDDFKTYIENEWDNVKTDWETLYNYVHDYFDNLDVQTEIDNKLNQMALDGTMADIIRQVYGNSYGVEIVSNTSDMTDVGKGYVLSSDSNGYIWFWDGTQFTQSSVSYLNPLNALSFLANNSVTDLDDLYRNIYNVSTSEIGSHTNTPPTSEGFIVMSLDANNASAVQIAYNHGQYNPEASFYIRKKSNSIWGNWVTYNAADYIKHTSAAITDLNDLYREYCHIATSDLGNVANVPQTTEGIIVADFASSSVESVQIAYNYGNSTPAVFYIRKKSSSTWGAWTKYDADQYLEFVNAYTTGDDLDNLYKEVTNVTTANISNVSNMPPVTSGIIIEDISRAPNCRIQLAYDYAGTNIPTIWLRKSSTAGVWSNWYELTRNFWRQITTEDLDDLVDPEVVYWVTSNSDDVGHNPLYMAAGYCEIYKGYPRGNSLQIVGSWANAFVGVKFIRTKQSTTSPWSDWNIINADIMANGYGFTVIGDSLSSGVTTKGTNNLYAFQMESWGKILANRIGCKYYGCTKSGASTVDWLNTANEYGINKLNRLPATPVYFINLGINDYNQTVSEADFKSNYADIIDAVRTKAPDAVIFCCKLWRASGYDTYSGYINDVLAGYSSDPRVILFDIQADVLASPINDHLYNGHFDVIGYKLIADAVETEFMNIANAHPELFRYEVSHLAEGDSNQGNGYPYVL